LNFYKVSLNGHKIYKAAPVKLTIVKKMTKTLLHPQEIEVYYVIPTLRRYIAVLFKEQGMKQKDAAEILGVNTATLSQYSSTKRGHKITFNTAVVEEIKKSVARIKDKLSYIQETQRLLHYIKSTKALCEIHHQLADIPCQDEFCLPGQGGQKNGS